MPAEKGIFLDILPRFDMVALGVILDKISTMFKKTGAAVGASFGTEAEAKIAALAEAERKASNIAEDAANRRIRAIHATEIAEQQATLATERRILAETRYQQLAASGTATDNALAASRNRVTAATIAEEKARYAAGDAALIQTARNRDALRAEELAIAATAAKTKAVDASTVSVNNLGRALNIAGMAATGTFLFGMIESGKAAGDYQEKLYRLVASAGETMTNLKAVADGLMSVSNQTGYSSGQLADGMYLVEKAGYRGADGVNVMRAAAQLARAENTSLDEVIQGLTTTMHDFHIPVDQAAVVASKMNVAVGEAKSNLHDFSAALSSVEPTAAIAKMNLEEVYAAMAQITQSGITPQRAGQNLNNMLEHLINIPSTQRNAMNKFGIDPDEVKSALGDPNVGLVGILSTVQAKIRDQMTPEGKVWVDTYFQSASAVRTLNSELEAIKRDDKFSSTGKALAENLMAGRIGVKEFTMDRRSKVNEYESNQLAQFESAYRKSQGFSTNLNKMQSQEETVAQAYKEIFGTDAAFRVAAQLAGSEEALDDYAKKILQLKLTTAEADGTVKGFNVTQETLNAKMRDAKAAFGNAAIQLGNAFLPALTMVADALTWVARGLAEHPILMGAVATAIGAMSAAWLVWKGYVIASGIAEAVGGMIAWFGRLQASVMLTITEFQGLIPAATAAEVGVVAAAEGEAAAIAGVGGTAVVTAGEVAGIGPAAVAAEVQVAGAAAGMEASLGSVAASANVARASLLGALGIAGAVGLAVGGTLAYLQSKPETPEDIKFENDRGAASLDETAAGMDESALTEGAYEGSFYTQGEDKSAIDDAKGKAEQQQAIADLQARMMPTSPFTKAETYAILQHGLGGKSEEEAIKLGRDKYGLTPDLTPSKDQMRLPAPDPGALVPSGGGKGKKGKDGKDLPEGTKADPVYTMPIPGSGLGVGGSSTGGANDSVGMNYDPFKEAGSGGWTLPNVARLMATFFTNLALGNPYGKLQAAKKGEDRNNPLYVEQVNVPDGEGGMMSVSRSQLKMINAVAREQQAENTYDKAVAKYGEDSPQAQRAYLNVVSAQQAIQKLQALAGINSGADMSEMLNGMDSSDPLAAMLGGDAGGGGGSSKMRGFAARGAGGRMAQGAGGAERWRGAVRMALLKYGPSLGISNGKAWEDALVRQIATESMGDPRADNPGDSNGRGGTQHVSGLLQFLPSTFAANNISGGNYMDPNAQIAAALKYVTSRYGMDATGAPLQIGRGVGYDTGGYLPPGETTVQNDTGEPELILNPEQQKALGLEPGGSGPQPGVDPNTVQHGSGQGARPGPPEKDGSSQITGGSGPGFGIKGGILGSALSAAGMAASMGVNAIAPGAGMAAGAASDILTQEANRFVGYMGQLAGIAAGGLLETFALNDSPLADPGKSLFGKIAFGIAGGHPSKPNTAGSYAPPLKQQDSMADQAVSPYGDLTITNNFHGTNDNAETVQREQNRGMLMYGGAK